MTPLPATFAAGGAARAADGATRSAALRVLLPLQALLVALVVFGDYLVLSASMLLTGELGNWLAVVAVLQVAALVVALALGQLRGRLPVLEVAAFGALCALGLAHTFTKLAAGGDPTSYELQKLLSLFVLIGPALWFGHWFGARPDVPGRRLASWVAVPLFLLCGVAAVTDPRLLTIEHFDRPGVFFGVLVLPAHQALAFALTKFALLWFALDQRDGGSRLLRCLRLGGVGLALGFVLLTGARSYALALVAALAVQSLLCRRRLGLWLIGAALAVGVYQNYASDVVLDRFDPAQALESLAYRERQLVWQSAWEAFVEHPVVGLGPGGFASAFGSQQRVYPHNLPLEIAAEFGVIGSAFALVLFGSVIVRALVLWQRGRTPNAPAAFACGLFVFGGVGALAVGDLIRNHFVFFATGAALAALPRSAAAQRSDLAHGGTS